MVVKIKKFFLFLIFLFSILLLSECVQKSETTPGKTPTIQPTETSSKVYGKEILKTKLSPEEAVKKFLPNLDYSWRLIKSDEGSTLSTLSEIPRIPEPVFERNISANMGGILATPVVEDGKIFLADGQGVYALNESNGELIWGIEIYFDSLEGREISEPQPWTKWRALGFYRFVESYGIGKYLFVGTSSTPEGGNGYLLAFNKNTGGLVWKAELEPESNASSLPSVTSNLIIAEGKVCVGSVRDEGYIFCFTEDGKFLWRNKIGGSVRGLAYDDGVLFATSEPLKDVHALDINSGKEIWKYRSDDMVSTPIYKDGKIFFLSSNDIVILDAKSGKLLKRIKAYGGADVNTNPYLAVGDGIILCPRTLGERPKELQIFDFEGNKLGEFKILEDEDAGAPVVTKNIVLIPVIGKNYGKTYWLWKGTSKLHEYIYYGDEIYMPKVSVAYGNIYTVFSYDRSSHIIIKFEDSEKPEIKKVEEIKHNESVDVKALIQDKQSGIYKALVAYKNGSEWHYVEMELVRKYVIESIGGYGFNEEEYIATIPNAEYVVIAIDNVGNYTFSEK